jgi:endo-1,4-beta-D-glucanase Y
MGITAWHVATKEGKLDILQKIWELTKGNLTREEINYKLLLATDKKGRIAWHMAAVRGKLDLLQNIWEWTKKNLTE